MCVLKFDGFVTSGLKKAGIFMKKDIYYKQYEDKLGFLPYAGTLNVKLKEEIEISVKDQIEEHLQKIEGNDKFGAVYFIDATLKVNSKKERGAILFPIKTTHNIDTLEFVSEKNLRKTLNLNDYDKVSVIIEQDIK